MSKGVALHLLAAIVIVVVKQGSTLPGLWLNKAVGPSETIKLVDLKWIPKGRNKLIFGVGSCADVTLTIYETSDQSGQYVLVYLGYFENNYALIIPSSDCDANGNCNINSYSQGAYLDCNNFMFFWVSWDLSGKFTLGVGVDFGVNPIIEIANGLTVDPYYADVLFDDANGGQMYVFIDDPPAFINPLPDGTTVLEIEETNTVNTALFAADVFDPEADPVSLYVLDDHSDVFTFSGTTLTNVAPLDYEKTCEYAVKLTLSDNGNIVHTMMTIKVINVFDEPPNVDAVSVTLPEELPIGSYVDGGFTYSDSDEGDQLTLSLSGSHAPYFEVTPDGRLKVAARIDFDPPNNVNQLDQLTLIVTDLNSNSNDTTLTFTVTDVNDMKPTFSQAVYTAEVTEGSGTVSLLQLTITDADSGVNADFDVTMDGDDPSDPAFTFDPSTLQLSVDANKLDYESLAATAFTSTLTFVATDKAIESEPRTGTTVAVIQVLPDNEFAPVWAATPVDLTIDESSPPGTVIGSYEATDEDLSTHGDVTYQVVSLVTDQGLDAMGTFFLDSGTGQLKVASPVDADTQTGGAAFYDITIQAADCCSRNVQTSFKINVVGMNDNAPAFPEVSYKAELSEDAIKDKVVLDIQAADADGDQLTYTLLGDGNELFQYISPALIVFGSLDYETERCFSLTLRASDGKNETDVPVTINITNVIDEVPVLTVNTPISLPEEQLVGQPLGDVYDFTDRDEDDAHTFSLEGTESFYFNINSTTGVIYVSQRMDREAAGASITDVTLKVTDSAGNVASETLTFDIVDINDNSPQFSSDIVYVNVSENTGHSHVIKELTCVDNDEGENANIVYSIVSGDDPAIKFKMDGSVLVTEVTPLNYESLVASEFTYTLIVKAEDTPSNEAAKSSLAVVVVKVLPENEFTPDFTLPAETSMTLPETSKPGYPVTTFSAVDEDAGADGDVSFEILSATDSTGDSALDKFIINPVSGELRLNDFLDADTATGGTDTYSIVVKATDGGSTPKSTNRDFSITVGNENDNAPLFLNFPTTVEIAENTVVGHAVVALNTEDNDGDNVVASIQDGDTSFFIISGNVDVILEQTLDYETSQCHSIVVGISDGTFKINRTLVINVTDVIDETPSIETLTPVNVTEELPVSTTVGGLFLFTDLDRGDSHTFTLTGGDSHFLNIDAESGQVSIAERMDLESLSDRNVLDQLTLTVTDTAGLQASADLSVEVVDINDASPVFAELVYKVNVSESSSTETALLTLTATDADDGNNGEFSFNITEGNTQNLFRLDGKVIYVQSEDVDYEEAEAIDFMYSVTVTAVDHATDARTGVTVVVVKILPVNEHDPVLVGVTNGRFPDASLPEDTAPGFEVLTAHASDADLGEDGAVTYAITSVLSSDTTDAPGKFTIDCDTGVLTTASELDFDQSTGGSSYYDITVTASDKGTEPKTAAAVLRVYLDDINDIAPVFPHVSYSANVGCSNDLGSEILTLTADDEDGPSVKYSTDVNSYLEVDSASGSVTLKAFPTGGAVANLAQSVVVTASDDSLESKCHLLVLFENCDTTTSVSTTTSTTATTASSGSTTDCPTVTCNCSGNATAAVTCPNDVTAAPCTCNNVTVAASIDKDTADSAEVWAMRAIVTVMAVMLMGAIAMYLKTALTSVPQSAPVSKVTPSKIGLERGIGKDDYDLKIEDFGYG